MTLNPELTRALRTTLPARRAFFIFAATLALVLIGGGLVWNGYQVPQYSNPNQIAYHSEADQIRWTGRDIREYLEVILFGLFFILAPATAALTFVQEKLRGTYIFQQMMLLTPARLATGKFIGSGLLTYFIAAIIFPFYIAAAVIGEQNMIEIVRISLLLIIGGLSCQAVGLLISAIVAGYGEKVSRGSLLIAPVVAFISAVAAFFARSYCVNNYAYVKGEHVQSWYHTWDFYGVPLPYFMMILALFAFVGAWAFVGTIRRIKENQLVPVSPRLVWLFIASAQFILVGLLWGWRGGAARPLQNINQFITINWIALSLLAAATAVSRGNLRELLSATTQRDANQILRQRNITDAAKTFAVWLVSSLLGLVALWYSFHVQLVGFPANLALTAQLAPVVLSFIFAVLTVAAIVQLCALYRFRLGAWSGILFAVLFYLITGVAGAMHTSPRNTFSLVNPIIFTSELCKNDAFVTRNKLDLRRDDYRITSDKRIVQVVYDSESFGEKEGGFLMSAEQPFDAPLIVHALTAQFVVALMFGGLAYRKWRRTEHEAHTETTDAIALA